jgi:DnaJ-class molecular chaperone
MTNLEKKVSKVADPLLAAQEVFRASQAAAAAVMPSLLRVAQEGLQRETLMRFSSTSLLNFIFILAFDFVFNRQFFQGSSFFSGGGGSSMFGSMNGEPFFSGMPGGMPRSMLGRMPRGGSSTSRSDTFAEGPSGSTEKPPEIIKPLKVSLDDLYNGSVKHLKGGRKLMDGSSEDKVLDIQIYPGWKSGTKIRFPKAGNEVPPAGDAQDLVFVVEEEPLEYL